MTQYSRPVPIGPTHDCSGFTCGQASLDTWLVERAWRNEQSGASRTFVTTLQGDVRVVGYYSLAASSVCLVDAPGGIRRNMPNPIPVILLGRLAVDRRMQGRGLGRAMLQDAARRVLATADSVGIRAMLVHALDDQAAGFYQRFGFVASPQDNLTLLLSIASIRASAPDVS